MKKLITTILAMIAVFAFAGCSSDDDSAPSVVPGTYFENYEEFLEAKNNWVEPETYSFEYMFGISMYRRHKVSVEIVNGVVSISDTRGSDTVKYDEDEPHIASMTDIFNYIESVYEEDKKLNKNVRYDIDVSYENKDGRKYIKSFHENVKHPDKKTDFGAIGTSSTHYSIFVTML